MIRIGWIWIVLAGFFTPTGLTPVYAADEVDPEAWYARMREPWTPVKTGFIQEWLILGEFPSPADDGSCPGCDTDYLMEHGGESSIRPEAGMQHTRPDGSTTSWIAHTAPNDEVDLVSVLEGRPVENVLAYAYTTVTVDEAGSARLALGSDDGVMVWVNGELVHRNIVGRGVTVDDDVLPIQLKTGENHILLKITQGQYGWGFVARVLPPSVPVNVFRSSFSPRRTTGIQSDKLTIQTDDSLVADGRVTVDVLSAGGGTAASQTASRGTVIEFDPSTWPDGAYEVRCKSQIGLGRPEIRYMPWYKGNPMDAVSRLLADAGQRTGRSEYDLAVRMLSDLVRHRVGDMSVASLSDDALGSIHSSLMEYEEILLEEAGKGTRDHASGFVRLSYVDPVDDSPQFCRVYLPHDYTPEKEWPVVIYLHGYNPENPDYIHWWAIDHRHSDRSDRYGMIYIEPHGRANTGYQGIGEMDVLRGLQMVKDRFSVDEDRVYLTGESMGGGGTWHVGTRNPELFAAISPVYGGWDYRVNMAEEDLEKLSDHQRFFHEGWSSFSQSESLFSTPVFVHHGEQDRIVSIRHSRFAVRELQRWQYNVRYAEYPHGNHFNNMGHWEQLMPWFLTHKRVRHPMEVRLRSHDIKDASAHWLRVEQIDHYLKPIHARAEIVGQNAIRLETENVRAIRLNPGGSHIDASAPVQVMWNEERHEISWSESTLLLSKEQAASSGLQKRPDLSGPISDVRTKPFAIVVGTQSTNELMNIMCRRVADDLSEDWRNRQKVYPRRFLDTEVTHEERETFSLILIGGAEANAVTALMGTKVPLNIAGDEVVIGERRVEAPHASVQLVYPNPWSTNQYVHVMAATSVRGMFFHRGIPDQMDFCVHDGRFGGPDKKGWENNEHVMAGRFGPGWEVTEDSLFLDDPALRTNWSYPDLPSTFNAEVETDVLYLSDLLEANSIGCFSYMQRNISASQKPIMLDGVTYTNGISVFPWSTPGSARWHIGQAGWSRLKAMIGVEYGDEEETSDRDKENTRVIFRVLGDGREIFVSEPFAYGDPAQPLDVDVSAVTNLTLIVHNEAPWSNGPASGNWAGLRLERE